MLQRHSFYFDYQTHFKFLMWFILSICCNSFVVFVAFHHVFLWQSIGCLKNKCDLFALPLQSVEYVFAYRCLFPYLQHIRSTLTQMACLTVCISMRLRCWYSINKVTFLPIEIRLEMWGIAMITSCLAATTSGSRGQWVGRLDKARQN